MILPSVPRSGSIRRMRASELLCYESERKNLAASADFIDGRRINFFVFSFVFMEETEAYFLDELLCCVSSFVFTPLSFQRTFALLLCTPHKGGHHSCVFMFCLKVVFFFKLLITIFISPLIKCLFFSHVFCCFFYLWCLCLPLHPSVVFACPTPPLPSFSSTCWSCMGHAAKNWNHRAVTQVGFSFIRM